MGGCVGMKGLLRGILAVLAIPSATFAQIREPEAAPWIEYGPFAERNQFLFNLLFLAFPGSGGDLLEPGERRILLSQVYANTFVGSPSFRSDPAPSSGARQRLTPSQVAAEQAKRPEESLFFVDTEQARTSLLIRLGVSGRFETALEFPFLSYQGGAFDGSIEAYHNNLNITNGGRKFYERNRTQIALTLGGDSLFAEGSPARFEPGDVSLFGRLSVLRKPRASLAMALGLKFPTGDPERLAGSGGTDLGVDLEGTLREGRQRLYFATSWVRAGDWSLFPRFDPADPKSLLVGYEFAPKDSYSWIIQVETQTTVFRGRAGSDLSGLTTEVLAGARWNRPGCWFIEAALIENLFQQNNGIDIGARAGAGMRLGRR